MNTTIELPLPVVANTETMSNLGGLAGEGPASLTVALPPDAALHGLAKPPFMIERSEALYWTAEWQDGVREALAALLAGKFRRFDSDDPLDLARWLLDDTEA